MKFPGKIGKPPWTLKQSLDLWKAKKERKTEQLYPHMMISLWFTMEST